MRNLRVAATPGREPDGLGPLVHVSYTSSDGFRPGQVYLTQALILTADDARKLAAELVAAADRAEGKATPAGAAASGSLEGVQGAAPAGDTGGQPCVLEGQDSTGEQRGVMPENRGLPSEADRCGICGQEAES
jgi:hypothetical protein